MGTRWFDSQGGGRGKRLERAHKRQRCESQSQSQNQSWRNGKGEREESRESGIKGAASRIRPPPTSLSLSVRCCVHHVAVVSRRQPACLSHIRGYSRASVCIAEQKRAGDIAAYYSSMEPGTWHAPVIRSNGKVDRNKTRGESTRKEKKKEKEKERNGGRERERKKKTMIRIAGPVEFQYGPACPNNHLSRGAGIRTCYMKGGSGENPLRRET